MRPNRHTLSARLSRLAACKAALAVVALSLVPLAMAQSPGTRERQIRVALVYKIARFVTWPDSAQDAGVAFTFCHAGDSATAQVFAGIEGRSTQGRRTRVKRLEVPDARSIAGCQLLYLSGSTRLTAEAREAAVASSVLVVVDGPREGADAGMVQLVPRANRMELLVDLVQARAARLRIDSTLLQLAEVRQ